MVQFGIYFTRQIQIFGFVFSSLSNIVLKIIEENRKKFEVTEFFGA